MPPPKASVQDSTEEDTIADKLFIDTLKSGFKGQDTSWLKLNSYFYTEDDMVTASKTVVCNVLDMWGLEDFNSDCINSISECEHICFSPHVAILVFEVQLSSKQVPEVIPRHFYLAYDLFDSMAYVAVLDTMEPIKIQSANREHLIAGRYQYRGKGTFKIFQINNNKLQLVWESPDHIYNYSLDCTSYEHGDMLMQNKDLNGDGYLDLKFTGIKNYYCKDWEQGPDREDTKPWKREKILLTYFYDPAKQTWVRKQHIGFPDDPDN